MKLLLLLACANDPVVLQGESAGSCSYVSSFSNLPECREIYGSEAEGEESCAGDGATFEPGATCEVTELLGTCTYEADGYQIRTLVESSDPTECGSNKLGCETFANGTWEPGEPCMGEEEIVVLDDPWPWPELVCLDPVEGEPPGESEDGKVCTWQVVSGATEEGRAYSDYADCDVIRRQRPYSSSPADDRAEEEDDRMQDPAYVAELDWVRDQVRSASCDCCHSAVAPDGPAVFSHDFEGNMANQFHDRGLAMGAGWIPTVGFGTYPAEDNNGFARNSAENPDWSAFPTTDQDRMRAFFEGELEHRGLTPEDFEGDVYGAGPLDAQLYYEPERCSADEGIDADGVIRWAPGRARFVYVLEAGSLSPTVPPNLDTPEGTLWRIDLDPEGNPISSETVVYGQVPPGMTQAWPLEGAPEPLVDGKDYYLYVTADVMFPISRCVFTAGEAKSGCDTGGGAPAWLAMAAALFIGRRRR